MPNYQHRFDRIRDYLHHRPLYLLVERIESITADEIVRRMIVAGDDFCVTGYFPGAPLAADVPRHLPYFWKPELIRPTLTTGAKPWKK